MTCSGNHNLNGSDLLTVASAFRRIGDAVRLRPDSTCTSRRASIDVREERPEIGVETEAAAVPPVEC
jgi:hypothetical protein